MSTCNTDILSSYLDDDLDARERAEVEFHLTACADCREVVADLAAIKADAPGVIDLDMPPAADLWPGIAARTQSARPRGLSLSWMQAIAAGLVLAAVSGGAVWVALRSEAPAAPSSSGPVVAAPAGAMTVADFGDDAYEAAVSDLREALDAGRNRLDPQTIQVIEKNLAAIDRAIAEARAALEADPVNVEWNSYLTGMRRRKLDLLRTAGELAQPSL